MPRKSTRLLKSLFKQEDGVDVDEDDDLELGEEEVFGSPWTKEETADLMNNIKKQLKQKDTFSYIRRIQLLNWSKVQVDGKTEKECKSRLQHLIKKIRHVRTLREILSDVDLETIDVRKPKSAYALFCEEMKNEDLKGNNFFKEASARFRMLSPEEKVAYEKESKRQSQIYKQQCPKGTRRKKTCTTPLMLFVKYKEKMGETNKDALRRQFAALEDSEKLKWIQMALDANEEDDFDKILSKDEQSILNGEPKPPLNAFNLFIRKKSAEGKIDFKSATEAYRKLSKEEKDVYIEMSRKAKIQYKHDLASYLFSMPEAEKKNYLKKLQAPKRTRVKRIPKQENGNDDEDVDDVDDNGEPEQFEQNEQGEHDEYIIQGENVEIGDIIDLNDLGMYSEPVDVGGIKMESYGEPAYNSTTIIDQQSTKSTSISETIDQPSTISKSVSETSDQQSNTSKSASETIIKETIKSKSASETPKAASTKSPDKTSKAQTTFVSESIDVNLTAITIETKSADEHSYSNLSDSDKELHSSASPKKFISKKRKHDENDDDASSVNSSISLKHKSQKKKRRLEENESSGDRQRRRLEENEPSGDRQRIKVELEVEEPERVASTPYHYFVQNIYKGKRKKAKKSYMKLDPSEKKRIKKEYKRKYKDYLQKLEEYFVHLGNNRKELQDFAERMKRADRLEMESSDPDDY